jgi:hypothetical protein
VIGLTYQDQKLKLTEHLLVQLGLPTSPKNVKEWHLLWWQNPRNNGSHSMRLTERGLEDFETKLELKSYQINFPEPIEIVTNQLILNLDRFIDSPYYVTRKYIKVFTEKMAVQLVLFSGDVEKYGLSKVLSQKNNTISS